MVMIGIIVIFRTNGATHQLVYATIPTLYLMSLCMNFSAIITTVNLCLQRSVDEISKT